MKKSLSVLFFFMLIVSAYGQNFTLTPIVNFFTPQIPEMSIRQNLQFNLKPDSKEYGMGASAIFQFDMKELQGDLGINYSNSQIDFTTQIIYWPTFLGFINFGVGFTYHFYDYFDAFTEQDFLADLYTKARFGKYFMMWTRWGGFAKYTDVKGISPDFKNQEKAMNFDLIFTWYPSDLWNCYFSFCSNSYFNYPMFMTIFLNTGAEFELIEDKIYIGTELSSKWYDFVVVAQNLSQLNIKFFARYRI